MKSLNAVYIFQSYIKSLSLFFSQNVLMYVESFLCNYDYIIIVFIINL